MVNDIYDHGGYAPTFDKVSRGDEIQKAREKRSPTKFVFDGLPVHELVAIRDQVTGLLPPLSLAEVNLEEEMMLQYHSTRSLQSDVIAEEGIPVNQRAQVVNAVASTLTKLSELQEKLYTSERIKAMERALIRVLKSLPEEAAASFLDQYKAELEKISGKDR